MHREKRCGMSDRKAEYDITPNKLISILIILILIIIFVLIVWRTGNVLNPQP